MVKKTAGDISGDVILAVDFLAVDFSEFKLLYCITAFQAPYLSPKPIAP
jgi:hypothetical protein